MGGDCKRNARFQKQLNAIDEILPTLLNVTEDASGKNQRFRKGAVMLQPAKGSNTSSECNASYDSETKLRDHQRMSHRGRATEEKPQTAVDAAQSDNP